MTAAAAWILRQEGLLRLDECVADAIPEFAANGKQSVHVERSGAGIFLRPPAVASSGAVLN